VAVDDLALVSTYFETVQNLGPSGIAKRQTGIVVVAGPPGPTIGGQVLIRISHRLDMSPRDGWRH
jgi:hypothetical protein